SSYRYNAQGKDDRLVTEHSLYTGLRKTKDARLVAYKDLFRTHLDSDDLKSIRAAWQTGTPLGNDYFREKIERKLKTKVGQSRRGRLDGPLGGLYPLLVEEANYKLSSVIICSKSK
ncbi:MAG: hypothetical protein L3K25_19820, partial [Gammaproteobacteria bacterium]|nr:hypothetical protein [Gammaproteobacteria bacterium]